MKYFQKKYAHYFDRKHNAIKLNYFDKSIFMIINQSSHSLETWIKI